MIAKTKNVSRTQVRHRLNIADLVEEAKDIIKGGHVRAHLGEGYFREIYQLRSKPHQILLCKQIIDSHQTKEDDYKSEQEQFAIPTKPMTYSDITLRIEELLELEKEGNIAPEAQQFIDSKKQETDSNTESAIPDTEESSSTEQLEFEIFSELSEHRESNGLRFFTVPMWIKHTNLVNSMCLSSYHLLQELVSYDLRFQPEKDKFFFIKYDDRYEELF